MEYGEEERRRLARELHDDISQRLALLADDADRLRREVEWTDDSNRRRLDNLVDQARSLSEDLRRISHTLHPAIVEDLGIVAALRSLTKEFAERSGWPAIFLEENVPSYLPADVSGSLYRVAQEALRNVQKHAGETSVRVTLHGHSGEVVLGVSDLGKGFDVPNETGLGITSMRERTCLSGGSFTLTSAPGKGTTIRVRLPVPKAAAH